MEWGGNPFHPDPPGNSSGAHLDVGFTTTKPAAFIQFVRRGNRGSAAGWTTSQVETLSVLYSLCNISGNSCPQPGNIPHGSWSCQMQEIPIPDATFLDGDGNTYPGEWSKASSKFTFKWHFLSALQCRLDCNPGYVAHKTPIITCVNGEYQPQARLWQESKPKKVFFN